MQTGDYTELLAQGLFYQSPELTKVMTGQKATLNLDVFPGETFDGVVQRVDPGHRDMKRPVPFSTSMRWFPIDRTSSTRTTAPG
jgi:hypothetical protein